MVLCCKDGCHAIQYACHASWQCSSKAIELGINIEGAHKADSGNVTPVASVLEAACGTAASPLLRFERFERTVAA